MKIAIGSDGATNLTEAVIDAIKKMGHEVILFGAVAQDNSLWPKVAYSVANCVATREADQGVLFCWTGTGVCIVANKLPGIRAALCSDTETAKGARQWNDANILVLSLRSMAEEIAKEILKVWFATAPSENADDQECFKLLSLLDQNRRI